LTYFYSYVTNDTAAETVGCIQIVAAMTTPYADSSADRSVPQMRWSRASGSSASAAHDGTAASGPLTLTPKENQWRRLARKLQDSDRQKSEFLARLSHELRNPLAPLSHALHLLRMHPGQIQVVEQACHIMQRQLAQLGGLVDDLLDIERIARGKVSLNPEVIELQEAVHRALELSQPLMRDRGHRLSVDLPEAPLFLRADPLRLTQVFGNLLNNAAKYTPPGGSVSLSVQALGEFVLIEVSDNGAGLAAEDIDHVFDLYAQVSRHLPMAQGGLGIGLALARQLVELLGGRISVRSPGPDQGSTFSVRLPFSRQISLQAPTPNASSATHIGRLRILVVDDNADGADALAAALQCDGHETLVAYDGPSALDQAPRFHPQVALLDLSMPGMDGFELARCLRQFKPSPKLVAMTGWGTATDRQRCEAAGFAAHLVKPAQIADIEAVLVRVLDGPAGGAAKRSAG
jgi:signal transduction histidine kinase/ActR/RegA family two-component response regulator